MECSTRFKYSKRGFTPHLFAVRKGAGFSAVEMLIVLAIFGVLLVSSMVVLGMARESSDLQAEARAVQQILEFARSKTVASEGSTRYGVYLDGGANQYVLFQGDDYASRVEEQVFQLRTTIEFGTVDFQGGQEVVFDRIEGTTSHTGSAVLRAKENPSKTTTVEVASSGAVEVGTAAAPTDNDRIKDSRHMHVDYTRIPIDVNVGTSEMLTLNFDSGAVIENVTLSDYLSGGEFIWSGEIEVPPGGEVQTLEIRTHRLNNPDTQFSIHRAGPPIHTKPLRIELSGDGGLSLIEYDAAGIVTQGTAAAAQEPDAQ